jgi:MFS family permease
MGPVRSTTQPCTRRCAREHLAANRVTAAAAAQASVSIVAFGLPAVGPDLREAYGLSLTMLGAALAATILGSGTFLLAAGLVVDRYGARRSTLAGSAVGAGGLAAAGFAPGQEALIGLLFLSGCSSRATRPTGRAGRSACARWRCRSAGPSRRSSCPASWPWGGIRLALVVSAVLIAVAGFVFAGVAEVEGGSDERAPFALSRLWRTAAVLAAAGASLAATLPAAAGKPLAAPTLP